MGLVDGQRGKAWILPCAVVIFAMFTLQMVGLGFAPLLPSIQSAFAMNYSQVGLFTGMYGILAILMSVPAGMAAKRFGEKSVLIAGMVVVFAGLLLLSRAPSLAWAYWGRAVWLTGYRFAFVSVITAVALVAPVRYKSRAMGFLGAGSAAASILGAPFGSRISQLYDWRRGMLAFGVIVLLGALVILFAYRQKRPVAGEELAVGGHSTGLAGVQRSAFANPLVWGVTVIVGFSGFGHFCANFFIPGAMHNVFHRDAVATAYLISVGYIVGVFANLLFGMLMDRYDRWLVLGSMFFLMIPASLAMISADLRVFQLGSIFMLALGLSVTNQAYGMAGHLLHGREMGNVMGIVSLGAGMFGYIGPQSIGWLRDWTGNFNAGWVELGIVSASAAALSLVLRAASLRRAKVPV